MSFKVDIFSDYDFSLLSQDLIAKLKRDIAALPDNMLNRNEAELFAEIGARYKLEPLRFKPDEKYGTAHDQMVPAEHFPFGFFVRAGQKYKKPVVRYHIPFEGDPKLLHCWPNPRILITYRVGVENNEITFDIVDFRGDANEIDREATNIIKSILEQSEHLRGNVESHNAAVPRLAKEGIEQRRQEIIKKEDTFGKLNLPMRKTADSPQTYSVNKLAKKTIPRPNELVTAGQLHPTLDESTYRDILQTLNGVGKNIEKYPSQYTGKDEESLRDTFLLALEARYDFQASGESFNKEGKTDILIKHEQQNLFIGECKFWGGAKKLGETIDQILRYLTWRDSKAAILFFVNGKEMVAPLKAIEQSAKEHPCYLRAVAQPDKAWFDYEFHLPGDKGTIIKLAILCFHFPELT